MKKIRMMALLSIFLLILTNTTYLHASSNYNDIKPFRYPQPGGLSNFEDFFISAEFATQEDIGGHIYQVLIIYPRDVLTREGAARYSEIAFSTLEAKMGSDRRWGDSKYMYNQFYAYCGFTSVLGGTPDAWIIKTNR